MNEIVLYFQNAMPLPYPVKRSKIIKITITKLNKLKLELKSKKIGIKLELLSSKKIVLKLQLKKYLKLQKHWSWTTGLNNDKKFLKFFCINICCFSTRLYIFCTTMAQFHQNCGCFWSLHFIQAQLSLTNRATNRAMLVYKAVEVWQDFSSEYVDKKFTYICYRRLIRHEWIYYGSKNCVIYNS